MHLEKIFTRQKIWTTSGKEVLGMAQGKVEICGVNTASLPVLGEEEKEALFARIKEGDQMCIRDSF